MSDKDFYKVLGVPRTAKSDEIKKAYRKLAMQYHPDRNPNNKQAEKKFKEITEAYDTLSDPQKKSVYDQFGASGFQNNTAGGGFSEGGFNFTGSPFTDIFEEVFGDVFGGGKRTRPSMKQPGNDIRYDLSITLEEAFSGTNNTIRFSANDTCKKCNGSGGSDGKAPTECATCRGSGRMRMQKGVFMMERTCTACSGTGQNIANPCSACAGQGRSYQHKTLEINIPAGVSDGTRMRINGSGESGMRGGPSGDLYVYLTIKPHKIFTREGNDLICSMPVPMVTAALGGEFDVPTIDGVLEKITVPAGTQSGHKVRVRGKGMSILRQSSRGDMYVEISVETPVNLTTKQQELLKAFASEKSENGNSPKTQGFFTKLKDFFKNTG